MATRSVDPGRRTRYIFEGSGFTHFMRAVPMASMPHRVSPTPSDVDSNIRRIYNNRTSYMCFTSANYIANTHRS
jgi:hypothetical protein